MACRTALAVEAAGVVCLAFPLHLPGRPEKSRAAELLTAGVPRLVLQGTKDTFGTPAEIRAAMGIGPRDPPGRASGGRPRVPGGQGRDVHRGRPARCGC